MNDSANTWLGVIAIASLLMAIAQIGVLVATGIVASRMARLASRIERELKPTFEHLNSIGRDASRAAALAAVQVERADHLFADIQVRVEDSLNTVQQAVAGPVREGAAIWSALRAAVAAFRAPRPSRRRSGSEDDDALFI